MTRSASKCLARVMALGIAATFALAACGPAPAPTPTPQPAPTKPAAPAATTAPAAASTPITAAPTTAPAAAPTTAPAAKPAATGTALEKVRLRLDFSTINGKHPPFFLAQEKGLYRQQGLDVDVQMGQGSAATVQLIGSGTEPFGFAAAGSHIASVGQGVPVTMVATFVQFSTACEMAYEDLNIRAPKDLVGKKIGGTPGGSTEVLFPALMTKNGLDPNSATHINLSSAVKLTSLLERKIDVLQSNVIGSPVEVKYAQPDKKFTCFRLADYGVNVLEHGVLVHNDMLKSKPDLVRRFVEGTIQGWEASMQNPDEAVEATAKNRPEINKAQTKEQLLITLKDHLFTTSTSSSLALGRRVGATLRAD